MSKAYKNNNFSLLRWFAFLSPIAIGVIALGNAWLISTFLNDHLFQREAEISRDFVQNILISDGSIDYLEHPDDPLLKLRFINSTEHLSNMHDVLRTNIYGKDRVVLWSTDKALVGQRFPQNDELDEALEGKLVIHAGDISSDKGKDEYVGLNPSIAFFVESYIPVIQPGTKRVIGAVELYKAPLALTKAIQEGRQQVALAALASALALYLCLYGLVRRGDRMIKDQRTQLMETETMAVVGELTTAVAHNIRNPLSSIRAAAEMMQAFPQGNNTEQVTDIIRETDRISLRITELLRLSGKGGQCIERVQLAQLLTDCIRDHRSAFESKGQSLRLIGTDEEIWVKADKSLLQQVFISLLSNASEAMPSHGACEIHLKKMAEKLIVEISDEGTGISPDALGQLFRPFFTTKPKGLGLGLPLAKRIVERFGGELSLHSVDGRGTTVTIQLPRG